MRASDALRAVAFHLSVEARVAVHAAVFPLAMRAGFALRAPVFYLAVRAGFARRAPVFHLAVRAGDARRAAAFDLAMRAGIALRAVVFQPAVRTRVALHAAGFLWLPVWAAFHFQFHTREFSAGTPRVSTVSCSASRCERRLCKTCQFILWLVKRLSTCGVAWRAHALDTCACS